MIQIRKSVKFSGGFTIGGRDKDGHRVCIGVRHLFTAQAIQAILNTLSHGPERWKLVDALMMSEPKQ